MIGGSKPFELCLSLAQHAAQVGNSQLIASGVFHKWISFRVPWGPKTEGLQGSKVGFRVLGLGLGFGRLCFAGWGLKFSLQCAWSPVSVCGFYPRPIASEFSQWEFQT